ncbi:hypothetical protein ACJJTC_011423, partial [Scirpophaga incertulas]
MCPSPNLDDTAERVTSKVGDVIDPEIPDVIPKRRNYRNLRGIWRQQSRQMDDRGVDHDVTLRHDHDRDDVRDYKQYRIIAGGSWRQDPDVDDQPDYLDHKNQRMMLEVGDATVITQPKGYSDEDSNTYRMSPNRKGLYRQDPDVDDQPDYLDHKNQRMMLEVGDATVITQPKGYSDEDSSAYRRGGNSDVVHRILY